MANVFFKELSDKGWLDDWVEILDWLLTNNEDRLPQSWSKGKVGTFTKRIKSKSSLTGKIKKVTQEQLEILAKNARQNKCQIALKSDFAIRDFLRHMRNSIAHGRAGFIMQKNETYIEMKDFKTNNEDYPTAYIFMPANCVKEIYGIYREIDKSVNNDRSIERGRTNSSKRKGKVKNV